MPKSFVINTARYLSPMSSCRCQGSLNYIPLSFDLKLWTFLCCISVGDFGQWGETMLFTKKFHNVGSARGGSGDDASEKSEVLKVSQLICERKVRV